MSMNFWMRSERVGFGRWGATDEPLAQRLWGEVEVTRYLCASGRFTQEEIRSRLKAEMEGYLRYGVQYWPIYSLQGQFLGCCGLRPRDFEQNIYELGFHILEEQWGKGYATEAARAVIAHAFMNLGAKELFAGHHPDNERSGHVLRKLGFESAGDEWYPPTGRMHPSYRLRVDGGAD